MANRSAGIFAEIRAHPGDAFAFDDVVGVDHVVDARDGSDVAADNDLRVWRQLADDAAHLAHFADVHDDGRDADDVVLLLSDLAREGFAGREIEHRTGRGDVLLNHHDAPGTMEETRRKCALHARHLVVIKLHRIDGTAAKLVVLRVRTEHGTQEDAGVRAFGMGFHNCCLAASCGLEASS